MPHIRPYRAGDWDHYLRLDLETGLGDIADPSPEMVQRFRERWPAHLKATYQWTDAGPTTAGSQLWVLEGDGGEYLGHVWTTRQEDFFTGEAKLFVTTVAVDARYRGQGHGRLLMEHVIARARDEGVPRVALGVAAANGGAVRLYEKLGFHVQRHAMELRLT